MIMKKEWWYTWERTLLKQAREERNLRQEEVAEAIKCSVEALSRWERGAKPSTHYCAKLCTFYGKSRSVLGLGKDIPVSEGELTMLKNKLESLDRRQLMELLSELSIFAGVDLAVLSTSSIVTAPDKFLEQCNAAIAGCWHLMKHGGMGYVGSILAMCFPTLSDFAEYESDYQQLAASLAMQGKTLQALLAMHRLDYMSYEIYQAAAVRFARMSGNRRLLAIALNNQGNTYTHHLPDTKRAISLYEEGISILDRNALLNRARLSMGLASAYALDGDGNRVIELTKQARAIMPKRPELDPFYQLVDFGLSDLDRVEGRAYLYLAGQISNKDYADKAYKAFLQGASKRATSNRSWSQTLIHLADASLFLDDFHKFVECLEQGIGIANEIDSQIRKHEASIVLGKAPEKWRSERKYQGIVKMF